MGALRRVGEDMKPIFTREQYEERKSHYLASLDPNSEYKVFSKIFCKHCRQEKTLDMPEHNFFIKAACDCEQRRAEADARRAERNKRAMDCQAANKLMLPVEVQGATFYGIFNDRSSENYINVCERCERFCRNFQAVKQTGRGIWLYGGFDTGKTYLAAAILKSLQSESVICAFTTMERILEDLKSTYSSSASESEKNVMARYVSAECLILDGFSGVKESKRSTENWAADRFCEIIKRRYEKNLPTVITSRSSIRELATDGLLPRDIVDKLVNKMVPLQLTESQRRARQQEIEF